MEPALGLRVVRGPDWEWKDQDGGEGYVGTVVGLEGGGGAVVVQWDTGQRCRYRCGEQGKYDLRILDSAQTGMKHLFVKCQSCLVEEISGMLWKCVKCFEYFLCSQCYMRGFHSVEHPFMRLDTEDVHMRVKLSPRTRAVVREMSGIFPNAMVVRGHDWRWKEQDGGEGNTGTVCSIKDWKSETTRSTVEVRWSSRKKPNVYRLGHLGKVDVKCIYATSGGQYYPEHLPILGAPFVPPTEVQLAAGDRVKVALDPDIWKSMQQGHGGWNDLMATFIGSTGVIQHIDDVGTLLVNYMSNAMFHVNPVAITPVSTPLFKAGDVVSVSDDMGEVRKLQKGHGEWAEDMAQSLGQVGRVTKALPAGDVQVSVSGRRWIYNPVCLKPAPGEDPQEDINEIHMSPLVKAQLESLKDKMSPEIVPAAAAAGDVSTIRSFLKERPNEVDAKVSGKTGLHVAAAEGYVTVSKTLLELKASVNAKDEDGETPLHYCAHLNQVEVAKELMGHGADPNTTNALGIFPLAVCTAFGNYGVLRVLVEHERTDCSLKDLEGNTALHVAVLSHRIDGVRMLLKAGATPTTENQNSFTPILEAAKNGFYAGMEQFMQRFPEEVNSCKADDGHTALHIAAANDYLDIVCLLASMDTCDLNAPNALKNQTPLHVAAQRGFTRIIERLVGYGANPNATDSDGNTPMSLVLTDKDSIKPPSEDSPEIKKVREDILARSGGAPVGQYVAVACFLAREGAGTESLPSLGCPPDVLSLITSFANQPSYHSTLHRSRPAPPVDMDSGQQLRKSSRS